MIKSIKHKGLRRFHEFGDKSGIMPEHSKILCQQLDKLEVITRATDMKLPGWRYKELKGRKINDPVLHQIKVNGAWRLRFEFRDGDVYLVDYDEFH